MSSQEQIDANRLNAQKSTGPSTPEGRAAVSLNGLKYGLYAKTLILPGEDPAEFEALLDRFDAEYQPTTPTEEAFVSQIVMATWRRARIQRNEVAYYKNRHIVYMSNDKWYASLDDTCRLGLIASHDVHDKKVLDSFSRHEARLERAIKSAVQELRRCRAARSAQDDRAEDAPTQDNKDAPEPQTPSTAKIGFGFPVHTAQPDSPLNPALETPPPTAC